LKGAAVVSVTSVGVGTGVAVGSGVGAKVVTEVSRVTLSVSVFESAHPQGIEHIKARQRNRAIGFAESFVIIVSSSLRELVPAFIVQKKSWHIKQTIEFIVTRRIDPSIYSARDLWPLNRIKGWKYYASPFRQTVRLTIPV
jgi:hypothetical protein